jgi:hypothetical protein
MYHWFILSLGSLGHIAVPGHTVRVYMPWLDTARNPHALKSYHNETLPLLAPEFDVVRGEPREGGCLPWFGAALLHNDRPLPIGVHFFFRDFFSRKLADLRGPLPRMDPCGLYYITRRGAGEGRAVDRAGMARRRNVENEADFLPLLVAAGFQVVHLEDYDVDGKVRLFAGARLVLSPQSASLTFSIFMDARADGHVASSMRYSPTTGEFSGPTKTGFPIDCLHYCCPGPTDFWALALYNLLLNNERYAGAATK